MKLLCCILTTSTKSFQPIMKINFPKNKVAQSTQKTVLMGKNTDAVKVFEIENYKYF